MQPQFVAATETTAIAILLLIDNYLILCRIEFNTIILENVDMDRAVIVMTSTVSKL
jgi:hypothetical protein